MSADVVGMERRRCIGGTTKSWENSGTLDHRMDRCSLQNSGWAGRKQRARSFYCYHEGVGVLRSLAFVLQLWGPLEDFKYHPQVNIFSVA